MVCGGVWNASGCDLAVPTRSTGSVSQLMTPDRAIRDLSHTRRKWAGPLRWGESRLATTTPRARRILQQALSITGYQRAIALKIWRVVAVSRKYLSRGQTTGRAAA